MRFSINFDVIRTMFGGHLTQEQVDNINLIVTTYEALGDDNIQWLAYILATAKWETAHIMEPVVERGGPAYFKKYDRGTRLGKILGNTLSGDGARFKGRGFVQLTGRANYAKVGKVLGVDLLSDPDRALEPKLAAVILVRGMLIGWFTGKGLAAYIDDIDESDKEDLREFINARRSVNGEDRATEIGQIALQFEHALIPVKVTAPTASTTEPVKLAEPGGWQWFIQLILSLFKKVS